MNIDYCVVSEQGLREDMEDNHCVIANFGGKGDQLFAGVFDGHGGTYAAHVASTEISWQFLLHLGHGLSVRKAFLESFRKASDDVIRAESSSGSCAMVLFIRKSAVFFANAGDSVLFACRDGRPWVLTNQHRIGNKDEEERIRNAGGRIDEGYVWVGNEGLETLRTIGDSNFKDVGVIATPECGVIRVLKPTLMLLGTDGLFDYVNATTIRRILSVGGSPDTICAGLHAAVKEARSMDNYTFMVFSLTP